MDCRGLLCGMGNTGSMTSADELNEQYDADGSVTQVPERNDEVHAGESAVAQSRESAVTIPAGTVVLAATPIGNVGDASARLVALLERADIVAAEDTRRLYDLARRLGVYVNGRVIAYHDHNERDKADGLLDQVETGATVLVVSDAGMPTINDPGLAIVRRAIERGLPVTCAPGPSAVLDALALRGVNYALITVSAAGEDAAGVRELVGRSMARLEPERVFGLAALSPAAKQFFARVRGVEAPREDKLARIGYLAGEAAYRVRTNGLGFVVENLRSRLNRF